MRVFTFDFPPSTNTAYYNRKGGRFLSNKGKTYKHSVRLLVMHEKPTDDFYSVSLHLHPPTKARRDCGNYEKLVVDAMSGYIYNDDSQIKELHIYMHHKDKDSPRVVVEVDKIKW